jgi:hypothetical protein
MAFRAASISAAISIFSAPGADTRLRAGDVSGERTPADPATIEARKATTRIAGLDAATRAKIMALLEAVESG